MMSEPRTANTVADALIDCRELEADQRPSEDHFCHQSKMNINSNHEAGIL